MIIELTCEELEFVEQYLETAQWADPAEDEWFDDDGVAIGVPVLCPTWEREAIIDCLAFLSKFECYMGEGMIKAAAHDLYLSRNGHGTGFWDNHDLRYPSWLAEKMQRFAEALGEHTTMYDVE